MVEFIEEKKSTSNPVNEEVSISKIKLFDASLMDCTIKLDGNIETSTPVKPLSSDNEDVLNDNLQNFVKALVLENSTEK